MISGVSTRSIQMALQRSLITLQRDMAIKQVEVQTGKYADAGLSLGETSETLVSVARDAQRLESILETNNLAKTRLTATQNSLQTLRDASHSVLSSLTAGDQTANGRQVAASAAKSSLQTMISALNVSIAGQFIFGGINSETAPINPGNGIPAGNEADTAFISYFGFAKTDPLAASISAPAFEAFVTTQLEPMFFGAPWSTIVSAASDTLIQSRITLKEVASTSVSANETGVRRTLFAGMLAANFLDTQLNGEVASSIVTSSTTLSANADAELAVLQSKTGLVEERVAKADLRIIAQRDLLVGTADDLSSIDPYETSVKLNSLLSQIEISYALTQKIQNLSILRFLG